MSSEVSMFKWRPELGQKTSMQQQDDTVDADNDGKNTDLLESKQFFFCLFFYPFCCLKLFCS